MLDRLLDRVGGRDRIISLLTAVVVIGVGVWIVAEAVLYIGVFGFGDGGGFTVGWTKWAQIVSRLANDVWLGALALLLLLWLVSTLTGSSSLPSVGADERDADLPSS
jgi:hypothetical protein